MLDTPVALIIFRRADFTRRILQRIAAARPRRLLVIADGPDPQRAGEAEKVARTRAVIETVDWDCEVLKRYSDVNLGVEEGISSGLNWVFENCEQAIVLEDDSMPHPSFFPYCAELLQRYRDDGRVSAINGTNLQLNRSVTSDSYYFSRYFHCWGFATWRRVWREYDVKMTRWPELRQTGWLKAICENQAEARYFAGKFDQVAAGTLPTWDYQVSFAMWLAGGLAVTPDVNLISNVGHGVDIGFYTKDAKMPFASLPLAEMRFPLRHPAVVARGAAADRSEYRNNIAPVLKLEGLTGWRLRRAVRRVVPQSVKRLFRRRF